MILDALTTFESARLSTVSVASTDIIDTLAAGDAYVSDWFVVQISTAAAITNGAPTCSFQLQSSSDGFLGVGNDITLVASAAFVSADMAVNKFWAVRIPPYSKRYLRGYRSIPVSATNNFSALSCNMFILADIDKIIGNPRYFMQSSS